MSIVHDVVVSELVKLVLNKISATAFTETGRIFRVKGELKRLQNTLIAINVELLTAEEQQFTNNSIRIWLLSLKDVVYDIEDLLDLISTEDFEKKFKKTTMIAKLFSYYRFSQELNAIQGKLDEIAENRRNYCFQDNQALTVVVEHRETCSSVLELHTFGREHEKELIISYLLKYSVHDAERISVIRIVGIGGMGKTTLAQLVFNDSRVIETFKMRLLVYVSKKFVLKSFIAKIIESVNGEDFSNLSMEALRNNLQAVLDGKTFLLILDDVWKDDSKQWIELQNLMTLGARSMILVTTREDKVLVVTGTTKPLKLKDLPEYHCWSLFVKHAFGEGEEEQYPLLVKLDKSIVRKCGGVPLAVKTLASFLRYKRDDRTWKRVSERKLWEIYQRENDIFPVLKMSLDHIPYQLRSCFMFCSLFRKGVPFYRTDIINMWMALGFLQVQNGSEEDELYVGHRYFDELVSRSFLQLPCVERHVMKMVKTYNYMQGGANLMQMSYEDAISQAFRDLDGKVTCTEMHDVVHDLASYVAGDEIAMVSNNVSPIVKHLMMDTKYLLSIQDFDCVLKARKARSFASTGPISKPFLERLISRFKCLRMLLLLHSEFEDLPDSIGSLKHLRYINLSGNSELKLLPDSTCKLINLQEFSRMELTSSAEFTVCPNLTSLPENIGTLMSLRVLVIRACDELVSLPNSMRRLTNLKHLTIHSCKKLDLNGLRFLIMFGIPKMLDFPEGIESRVAGTLQYLRISECKGLRSLPKGLIRCTCLLKLQVYQCPDLRFLPKGFDNLTSLQELRIFCCPELSCRCQYGGDDWNLVCNVPEMYIDDSIVRTRYS